ncbi:MAG TPA: fused MFS/spermidine synthase [Thermoguttaceae bacterium]|nr:fused MFS/spermidine synthase [Thermoguttaceae bacterium]
MKSHRGSFRAIILLFFLVSGATGLVLEVVWTRILGTVFGNTVYAASTVLTAYMLGLAVGSLVLGRVADRSERLLRLYGWLEVGVGLYAMLFPLLAAASLAVYAWFYQTFAPGFALLNLVRFGLSLLLLLPPTFLMGGTLPVLGRFLSKANHEPGRQVGYLYGVNTAGAVCGCFLAGFVLLQALGVRGCLVAAGSLAMSVGALAILLGRRRDESSPEPIEQPESSNSAGRRKQRNRRVEPRTTGVDRNETLQPISPAMFRLVVIAFALTGFCSLAYEVLCTRVLIFVLSTSTYSFVTMLTVFLTGIALGSFLSARFVVPRLRRPVLWFGLVEVLVGMSVLASDPLLAHLERIDFRLASHFVWGGQWHWVLTRFADAFVVLLLPTLLMGAAFPIVTTACLRDRTAVGRHVGHVYAANAIGCVAGSFAAGFVLLPLLGTHRSMLTVVVVNLGVGVVLVWRAGGRSVWTRSAIAVPVAVAAIGAFVLTPSDIFYKTINAYHNPCEIIFLEEHATGTVAVHDLPGADRLITVAGVDVAGRSFMLRTTQKLQGYIPLCLHPNPQRVVQIGFGSGETARVGLDFGVEDYTVVEICPAVFKAGACFEEINHGSYRDPRIRRIIMDGKNFARLSDEKFDIVMNDSIFPGSNGSSSLYGIDHFRNCRRRLAEGGLFSCWVPLDLRPVELRMILRSFQEVFPHTSFWVASNCLNKHGLILGSLEPLKIDLKRLDAVMKRPEVAADLKAIAINDVYDLLDCHVCDEEAVREMVADAPIHNDDRPRLEFSCAIPSTTRRGLTPVLSMLCAYHVPIAPSVVNFVDEDRDRYELQRRFAATGHILQAQVAQLMGDRNIRRRELDLARVEYPLEAHVASCEAELADEIRVLRSAVADRPKHRQLACRLADQLYMASKDREAAQLYEQLAQTRPPMSPQVFVRLAEIRFREGHADHAEEVLGDCLKCWPSSAEAHDLLAGICLRTGRVEIAKHHIAEALRVAPADPRYQAHSQQIAAVRR